MVLMQSPSRMSGVTLINAYVGVKVNSGRCIVENCYIGAYKTCVDVDQAQDVTYFNNVWCSIFYETAFGIFPFSNMDNWVQNNGGVAFKFGRADAVFMTNCGCFLKWAGLYCADGAVDSLPSYGLSVNFDADLVVYGAVIYSTNAAVGWQLLNFQALPTGGSSTVAATPLFMPTGGSSPPIVHWSGGTVGLGVPNNWTVSQQPVVNAGQLSVRGVSQLPDRMLSGVVLSNLPTSSAGLVAGQVWRNGTVLNVI
jgi:hypothetical protein